MAKDGLSARQERILEFIGEFLEENNFPPTVRDIQTGCEVSSTSVVDYNLRILNNKGYLRRREGVSRGIELVGGKRIGIASALTTVPIFGNIAAGLPLPTLASDFNAADEFENVELPPSLIDSDSDVFALRVKGTSMIDALVADGDLVLLESTRQAENGDMVAAWLKYVEETTLKRFYLQGDTVRLQPENEMLQPLVLPADQVEVHGRVIGVIRTL